MKTKYNWKEVWELVKQNKPVTQDQILYTEEKIPWYVVQDFNFAGLSVPNALIDFEYDTIDYSDIPSLDILIEEGSYKQITRLVA